MVSKGQFMGLDWNRITRLHSQVISANSLTASRCHIIGYINWTDFLQISPKRSRNNDKRKRVGKFCNLKNLSRAVHLRNTPRIFFATPTLDADI